MKYLPTILAASAALAAPAYSPQNDTLGFYIALQSTGIVSIDFDPSKPVNTSLTIAGYNKNAGYQVNWLTAYQDHIYSISRTNYPTNATQSGGVFAFEVPTNLSTSSNSHTDTNLTLLNTHSSFGLGGVFLDASPGGKTLAAANIDGGTVSIYPLVPKTGTIDSPTYTFKYNLTHPGPGHSDSQTQANPHMAIFDPSGKYIFVPDRGSDRVYIYSHAGPHAVNLVMNMTLLLGTGPRHITFTPINAHSFYWYLVSELDNVVRVFHFDYTHPRHPANTLIQIASTLGKGYGDKARTPPTGDALAAELAVTNDGKFLYASNRNTLSLDPDTMAVFARNASVKMPNSAYKHLTYLGTNSTQGKLPRMFALSPDKGDMYVAVANEITQDVTVFKRNGKSGFLGNVVGRIVFGDVDVGSSLGPICVLWK